MYKLIQYYKLPAFFVNLFFGLLLGSAAFAGDKYLSKEDVLSHVSNKTEEWSKGAGYYGSGGELKAVWEGKKLQGSWRVKDNGEMCITIAAWGDEDCHKYRLKKEVVQLVYKGKGTTRKVDEGDKLGSYL